MTRLENAASAHGDQIKTALDDCTTRLATALDKTAMKACALLLLAITIGEITRTVSSRPSW